MKDDILAKRHHSSLITHHSSLIISFNPHGQSQGLRSFEREPRDALLKHVNFENVVAGPRRRVYRESDFRLFAGREVMRQRAAPVVVRNRRARSVEPVVARAQLKRRAGPLARAPNGVALVPDRHAQLN